MPGGRTGEWAGTNTSWNFGPHMPESQSYVNNDAEVYETPGESYKEPTESADVETYKERRETTTVGYVTTSTTGQSTTGQRHKLRPRKARLVADGCSIDIIKSKDARRRQPPGYSPSRPQVSSDIPSPDIKGENLVFRAHQFRYLIGTKHHDDDEGGDWETMRVDQEGDNVVVYRRQVIGNGTKLSRTEDGPIWICISIYDPSL